MDEPHASLQLARCSRRSSSVTRQDLLSHWRGHPGWQVQIAPGSPLRAGQLKQWSWGAGTRIGG
jgi:hypothetical protein